MTEYKEYLLEKADQMGFILTEEQVNQFIHYMVLLLAWNTHTNLTAIKEPKDVLEKHFLDSLMLEKAVKIPVGAEMIDVGSGAGFPGVPLKLLRPDINLTALDSGNKRLAFLKALGEKLNVEIKLIHARAEEAGRNPFYREKYDIATARAVAAMPVLCEYCIPFVKKNGFFAALKGPLAEQEAGEAENAAKVLGCGEASIYTAQLPSGDSRGIVLLQKQNATPKEYPRHGGTIQKKPL